MLRMMTKPFNKKGEVTDAVAAERNLPPETQSSMYPAPDPMDIPPPSPTY